MLIIREQYSLDILKPDYKLKIADLRLGSKHSPETLLIYKSRKLSPEAIANLKKAKVGKAPISALIKQIQLLASGHVTTVLNKENNSIKVYDYIGAAARSLGTSHNSLFNYINSNKLYKGVYLINNKLKTKI